MGSRRARSPSERSKPADGDGRVRRCSRSGAATAFKRPAPFGMGWLLGPHLVGVPEDPTVLLAELDAWGRYDATDVAASVTCPTLVIGAERDRLFPPIATRQLAQRLPSAELVTTPGIAHSWPPRRRRTPHLSRPRIDRPRSARTGWSRDAGSRVCSARLDRLGRLAPRYVPTTNIIEASAPFQLAVAL